MEFEDDKQTCASNAIGSIPLSASLKRERENQGSHSKSFVSQSSLHLSDADDQGEY